MFPPRIRRLTSIASLLAVAAQLILASAAAAVTGGADWPLR